MRKRKLIVLRTSKSWGEDENNFTAGRFFCSLGKLKGLWKCLLPQKAQLIPFWDMEKNAS